MSRLTRGGTAELVSRHQILWREKGQGNINFPRRADHEQDWQFYPVDPYSAIRDDHTTDTMFVIYRLQELARKKRIRLNIYFIDLTKAYDFVDRALPWRVLARFGVQHNMISVIRQFHDDGKIKNENKNAQQAGRTIKSLVHKLRLHGRRGKRMAESFS